MRHPEILQGGMGVGVSGWRLARAVSKAGQLGVVSGTALDVQLVRRLQLGDRDGHLRRSLARFPNVDLVARVLARYYRADGPAAGRRFTELPLPTVELSAARAELMVLGSFVEVDLAREGHDGVVGINLLEKIQIPTLAVLYGALLARVDYVLMGAGIPLEIPAILDRLARHEPVSLTIDVGGDAAGVSTQTHFDPATIGAGSDPLLRPFFFPIVSAFSLAQMLLRRAGGRIDGFVVEAPSAGGHNAPPRGPLQLDDAGQPIYGARDEVDLQKLRTLGVPFWLAGRRGGPGQLQEARALGAAGIQVGTAFAFCAESGLTPELRRAVLDQVASGRVTVHTDPLASPTGFPFKVVQLGGTLSDPEVFASRRRACNMGYLRKAYRRSDGRIGYRCPAEPVADYVRKGGSEADAFGRKCLCNALAANVGLAQALPGREPEKPMLTAGDALDALGALLDAAGPDYTAADVLAMLAAPVRAAEIELAAR